MRTSFQICVLSLVALIIGVAAPRVNAQCTGDIYPNGLVDAADLAQLLVGWGPCANCPGDIDRDGAVTGNDLGQLLGGWGPCAPFIASVAPAQGTIIGGTPITILGAYFTGATSVSIGGALATNMVVVSSTTITAVTPAHAAGSVSITITTPNRASTFQNAFSYASSSILSVVPNMGWVGGGTQITISGNYLGGATSVTIGGAPATNLIVVSPTTITAVTPTGTLGPADVIVTTPAGTPTSLNSFSYVSNFVPAWATLLEASPDPAVVTDTNLRAAIVASGFVWRVRDTGTGIEMLLVPGGTFTMGCSPGDAECGSDESPVHQVTLTNAFYMGKTEVTQAQWQATMGSNPSYFSGQPNNPVEQVSWNMIQGFNTATGLRLPTEAEWEIACRAWTTTARYGVLEDIAWYDGNAGNTTHAVATKLPNALGLYDTIGNVWEWCQDWYEPYSSGSVTNPTGPTTGTSRLLRGGGWYYFSVNCRASQRGGSTPGSIYGNFGFRVARTP